jgi:hypothetical protein
MAFGNRQGSMRIRELQAGSPEAKRRDELLAIMRDETKSEDERYKATVAALPLCHEELPPIVVYTRSIKPKKNGSSRMASRGPKTLT